VRTPFVGVTGHLQAAIRSRFGPVVQAMAERANGPIDFGVWGAVIPNLAYANLAREVARGHSIRTCRLLTTIMQCSTSMVGAFEAAGMLARQVRRSPRWAGSRA
jgi:acetyl-CoA C-acetyltransferase